jgi:hypothetical protein
MANCGVMPATLLEALLSAGRVNGAGVRYINLIAVVGGDDDPSVVCGDNVSDPEASIVADFFDVDANGHLGLKVKTI